MLCNVQLVTECNFLFGVLGFPALSFLWIQHESLHFQAIVWHSFVYGIDELEYMCTTFVLHYVNSWVG